MDNSGQTVTYAVSGVRGKKIGGTFLHFLIGLLAALFTLHKHAIQTLSIPPNKTPHTFIQTQLPRHHHNINKHCPHAPTQYSHTVITYRLSIPTYITTKHTTNHSHTASIQYLTFTIHKTTSQRVCITSAPQSGTLYHYLQQQLQTGSVLPSKSAQLPTALAG